MAIVPDPTQAAQRLAQEQFDGLWVEPDHLCQSPKIAGLFDNEQILQGIPDAVVLLDPDNKIAWCNQRFLQWSGRSEAAGSSFYGAMGRPEILGPDFCPFQTARSTGAPSSTTLRAGQDRHFRLHAAPLEKAGQPAGYLVVTLHDVTAEIQQQQKMAAIHQAGTDLAGLMPDELLRMSVPERIDLLKSNILRYTKDLLKFEVVEIRLLDRKTGRLEPLLSVGMEPEAASRVLYAQPQNNGVTGFVAATGKSYLCEDTTEDPLYLPGAKGARSSLTVPLLWNEQVIGTFNVESPEPRAFSESDLQFLEIFARDVAAALNTLELLVAEKASATAASVEAIHSAVALPVDEILNDAVALMERYGGDEPDVVERLQRILHRAREVRHVIQMVGQRMAPGQAPPPCPAQHQALRGRQVLLVDDDPAVRGAAHALLERYGCNVETAPDGTQALGMVRAMLPEGGYDAIIADIRLPDMTGYELLERLRELLAVEIPPLILATQYGYDPAHSIVRARQAGLRSFLFKPFRLDQLLDAVEQVLGAARPVPQV